MSISVIITGATGMVGEGVLLECVADARVSRVLVINRKPSGVVHPKLVELVHSDFSDLSPIQSQLAGYDACFFCLGVSSLGMSEAEYKRVTYDLTVNMGRTLARLNPQTTFCYVTGAGTDSTEHGKTMWARVKGATENELLRLFPRGVMFRPGMMRATPGQKNLKGWYHALAWIYPVGRALWPAAFCTLQEVGQAMINAAVAGSPKRVLEVKDIVALAHAPRN
ncbi:NAD-dependent epimerase/dehydratase family protein [Scleromatobacter humisilvae]|uniref:NAD-dependent epimerase/dehydratase family protein n=1 Tax=Scleromatobacter humisilvae TaxID=2897159 RepID=UPI0030842654